MRPVTVAVTGGIGAGKSAALEAFARHGAAVLSSDAVVHDLLAGDREVRDALAARWGAGVADDRSRIASIVFADPHELEWLEALLHPRVRAIVDARVAALREAPEPPAVVAVEIPLLYETGGERRFDRVVVVTAPLELRTARSRVRDDGRAARLLPDEEKAARADYAFVNDGSLEELDAFVARVVAELSSS